MIQSRTKIDFGLMEQALFNILHNASLYTPDNSTIKINCSFENKITTIEISDNGQGIEEINSNKVFSKFYQPDKTNTGGTGLGLSIVKGFIEAHNGKITFENNFPSGAKFTIKIPAESYQPTDVMVFADTITNQTNHHEY